MHKAKIAIIGGGLSGLYAAYSLQKRGIWDYVVLEARETLGGRIHTVLPRQSPSLKNEVYAAADAFDLGPSWFWPGYQTRLSDVIHELGLKRYPQFETGDMIVERSRELPVSRMNGYLSSPPSMRITGGMAAVISALQARVDASRIHTGQLVTHIQRSEGAVEITSQATTGAITEWSVDQVLLAMPPRLVQASIEFAPALPATLSQSWKKTATWMAPHAKYFAVYETPFWRDQGLSGSARSSVGPLVEIHDASIPQGSAALFGFVGVPAAFRRTVHENDLRALCRAQLTHMFGQQAAVPKAEFFKDWAMDIQTAVAADLVGPGEHAIAPPASVSCGPWEQCLVGIGSEWSPQFPGYVAGAIDAVDRGLQLHA